MENGREARLVQGQLREYEDVQGKLEDFKTRSMEEVSSELGKLESGQEERNRKHEEIAKHQVMQRRKKDQVTQTEREIERLEKQRQALVSEIVEHAEEIKKIEIPKGDNTPRIRELRGELTRIAQSSKQKERYEQKERLRGKLADLEDERESFCLLYTSPSPRDS